MGKIKGPKIKRWDSKYYINNLKSMALWKKVMLVVFVIVIVGSGFKVTMWKQDNPLDWSEKPPIYGIQKKIDF